MQIFFSTEQHAQNHGCMATCKHLRTWETHGEGVNLWLGRYLTQLLADNLAAAAPSRVVWVTSLSEGVTPDINFDNLK